MFIQQFFIEGLGCASYLVGDEQTNSAAVIDPDREVQKYLDAAHERGLKITHIVETHLHADHISGNTELAARTGATIYLHESADAQFPHASLREGDTLAFGGVRIHILHTPGHTLESITLLLADTARSDEPALALTGDTLFVGDVGRPDLVGSTGARSVGSADAAQQLAGAMHDSLQQKILPLHDGLIVYPGHGAGSLCGRAIGALRVTSLGYERQFNPALAPRTREEFIVFATSDLPEQPGNHKSIKAMNRQGPRVLGDIEARALDLNQAIAYFQRGAGLLDTRAKAAYIARHIPGSVHLEANDQLSNRVGMALPPQIPLVLLLDDVSDYRRVFYMLARVGYDNVVGYLPDLDAWEARGLPVVSGDIQDLDPRELETLLREGPPLQILDVREPWEFRMGHVPGAKLIPLGELQARAQELDPNIPVAVICQSGNRSQTGAAILAQKGFVKLYNIREGTLGWRQRGFPIE
jgi:hydroxyacylglutathione hydrolase